LRLQWLSHFSTAKSFDAAFEMKRPAFDWPEASKAGPVVPEDARLNHSTSKPGDREGLENSQ
jgi:hypothetical protein